MPRNTDEQGHPVIAVLSIPHGYGQKRVHPRAQGCDSVRHQVLTLAPSVMEVKSPLGQPAPVVSGSNAGMTAASRRRGGTFAQLAIFEALDARFVVFLWNSCDFPR